MNQQSHKTLSRAFGIALAMLAVVGSWALTPTPLEAQEIRIQGFDGGELKESDLARGATILVVWASWSPKCRDIASRVEAIKQRWGSKARVVTVNFQEDRSAVSRFVGKTPVTVPVYLDSDGAFSKKYAVTTLPGLLIIRDGTSAYQGKLPEDPNTLIGDSLD